MKPCTSPILTPARLFQGVLTGLLASASVGSASAQIISVNFGANESSGGSGNISTTSSLTAGAILVPGTGWNNASNATGSTVTNALGAGRANLLDSTGADTSATISWTSANTWRSGSTGPTVTSLDGALTKGYLDDGGSQAHVTVSNVPYLTYNVYTIIATDQTGAGENIDRNYRPYIVNGTSYKGNNASGTLSTSTVAGTANWTGKSWTDDDALTQGSHYLKMTGQSAGTLTVDGNVGQGTTGRGSIAGIQIENTYVGTLSYWDIDGATAGAGGATPAGTWDGATSNWSASAAGTAATSTWTSGQAAVFSAGTNGTGNYTVSVSGTQTADALWIQRGNVTLSGGTVNLTGSRVLKVTGGSLTLDSALTADGPVSASGSIAFPSPYSVGITLNHSAGTLSGSALTVTNGGTLSLAGSSVISNAVTVNAGGTVAIAPAATTTTAAIFTGGLTNNGSLTKNGAGTLNVFTTVAAAQGLTVGAGIVQVGNNDATGDITALTSISLPGGTLNYARSDNTTLAAGFSGAGGTLNKNSTGVLTLTGSGAYAGAVNLNGGTLTLVGTAGLTGGLSYLGNPTATTTTVLNVQDSASIVVNEFMTFGDQTSSAITINQTGGSVTNNGTTDNPGGNSLSNRWGHWGTNATTTYNLSGGSLNLPGAPLYLSWDSAATLNISGTGVASLKGINMGYNTRVNASTINLNAGGTLNIGNSGITSGGLTNKTINFNGGTYGASATHSITRPVTLTSASSVNLNGNNITLAAAGSGSGALTVNGAGTLVTTVAQTYSGGITFTGAGGLSLTGASAAAQASLTSGTVAVAGPVTWTHGAVTGTLNAKDGTDSGTNDEIIVTGSANISGTVEEYYFTLNDGTALSGEGTIKANTSFGTTAGNSITVNPNTSEALTVQGDLAFNGTTTITLSPLPAGAGAKRLFNYTGSLVGTPTLNVTGAASFRSASVDTATPGQVNLVFGAKSLSWSGTQTIWDFNSTLGWTDGVNPETFYWGDSVTLDDAPGVDQTITVNGNLVPAALVFNNSTTTYTLNGGTTPSINGEVALVKNGTGTVILNTPFTGTLGATVNAGTLALVGDQLINRMGNSSTLTINAGGTVDLRSTNVIPSNANAINVVINGGTLKTSTGATHEHLKNITLNGGTLTTDVSAGSYDGENYQLNGDVTVTGTSPSTISPKDGLSLNGIRTFTVADVTGSSATDLLVAGELENNDTAPVDGFIKAGAGTMTFTVAPVHTGATTVNDGTVEFATATTLTGTLGGTITGTVAKSGTGDLVLNGGGFPGTFVVTAGSIVGNSTNPWGTHANAPTFLLSPGTTLTNSGTSTHAHVGNITLNNATWTTAAGTGSYNTENYQLNGNVTVTGSAPSVITREGTRTDADSGVALRGNKTFSVGDVASGVDLTVSTELEPSDDDVGFPSAVTKSGAGTMLLANANSYTAGTTVTDGTLQLGNALALGNGAVTVTGGTLDLNGQTIANGLTISGGSLELGGGNASGAVALAAGATITGSGTVSGALGLNGNVSPGGSGNGLITLAAPTFSGTSNLQLQIAATGTRGTNYDAVTVSGVLVLDGTVTVSLNGLTAANGQQFDLIDSTGAIDVTNFDVNTDLVLPSLPAGLGWDRSEFASDGVVAIITTDPLPAWAATYSLTGNDALPGADPDGDGISNAIEYAFGTSPIANNGPEYRGVATTSSGALTLTYRRPLGGVAGVTYGVEFKTADLVVGNTGWTLGVLNTDYTESITPNGDGTTETVVISLSGVVSGKKFARVAVAY